MLEFSGLPFAVHPLAGAAPAFLCQFAGPMPAWYNTTFKWQLLIVLVLTMVFVVVRATLSVESPNGFQSAMEMVHEFVGGQLEQIIGHGYERFQAFLTCILLFVLLNNFMGLYPSVETPTSVPKVPLGLAVLSFLYYNLHGLRVHGPIGYLKTFVGPVWWISWLLFPVEVISHLARMMSLTIRLYANMLASDLLTMISFSILPFLLPVAFLGLHFLVSVIQAYVFFMLSAIYIAMAVAHEH